MLHAVRALHFFYFEKHYYLLELSLYTVKWAEDSTPCAGHAAGALNTGTQLNLEYFLTPMQSSGQRAAHQALGMLQERRAAVSSTSSTSSTSSSSETDREKEPGGSAYQRLEAENLQLKAENRELRVGMRYAVFCLQVLSSCGWPSDLRGCVEQFVCALCCTASSKGVCSSHRQTTCASCAILWH